MKAAIEKNLKEASEVLKEFSELPENIESIENAASLLIDALKNGHKIITCGNGGSMTDAMHFAEELSGRYRLDRKPLPASAISDPGHISCVGNDYGYSKIFSRYLEACSELI